MDSYNPGKRSRDELDGGYGAPGTDYEAKKQHVDPTAELISNVCKDIRRIGENNNIANQVDDISYISNPIVAEFEQIDELRTSILSTLYAVVVEQPQKINSLSVLILICNAKNFLVAKYVVEYFHSRMQRLIDSIAKNEPENKKRPDEDAGALNNLKSILKFLATLSPIISDYSIIKVFKQLLEVAVELQDSSESRSGVAEELYYNVLIALPYLLSNDFSQTMIDSVNDLVATASNFAVKDLGTTSILEPFDSKLSNFADNLPYQSKRMVNLILPAILKLQGDDKLWEGLKGKLFIDFAELVEPIVKAALENNTISSEIVKHPLPQLSLPSVEVLKEYQPTGLIDSLWYKHSRLLFQVYNITTEFETVPSIETYVGLFFKDLAFDILTNLSFNQKEASIQLSILDLFFSKNLFTPPGSSIDQLTSIHQDNVAGANTPPLSTWKIEDVAVESILTMIFQLPSTLHYEIYYYTVLISCCRESPESIAPVFGRAIRYFYNNLEMLDYELKVRFLDWMTTQISNFEFSWKWDEWVADSVKLAKLQYHPKKNFIKNLVAKEVRLSNKSRIKDSFITINQQEDNKLVYLDEFYQYLNISLFPNEVEYVIDYDALLYGNPETREKLETLIKGRKESLDPFSVSPQEELLYHFSNPDLPLNEVANKVYDFIVSNWKPDEEFDQLYNEILDAATTAENPQPERFLINVLFQTYAYVGSRSIYSIVSILNRDVNKLKYASGVKIAEEDYAGSEYHFKDLELSDDDFANRQHWIIDLVFRIWVHQPQVAFLILEYLIEFGILRPRFVILKAVDLQYNLIIQNVSCMESINRILSNYLKKRDDAELKSSLVLLFELIVSNLNTISGELSDNNEQEILITKDVEDASDEQLANIDKQWLFYEYRGLLKTYLRKFSEVLPEFEGVISNIANVPVRDDASRWLEELK